MKSVFNWAKVNNQLKGMQYNSQKIELLKEIKIELEKMFRDCIFADRLPAIEHDFEIVCNKLDKLH